MYVSYTVFYSLKSNQYVGLTSVMGLSVRTYVDSDHLYASVRASDGRADHLSRQTLL